MSKNLVSLNNKYVEAMEQVTKSAKTFVEHDKTSKALKEPKMRLSGSKRNPKCLKKPSQNSVKQLFLKKIQ